jgi:hypothetical protein
MIRRVLLPLLLVAALSGAHIGSPDVVYDGTAGPYPVRVVVRPPSVVPGVAQVIVQLGLNDPVTVNLRPVFWKAGVSGAPKGDDAARVVGEANLYAGQLWLMSRGAYSVYVTVSGSRGSGTAIVPVSSFATGRLNLSPGLAAILVVLGGLLFAGLVTIVRAASGEALLEPGEIADAATRRRGRKVAFIFAPILAIVIFGGAKWWGLVDDDYERTMYRPPAVDTKVIDSVQLELNVHDTAAFHALFAPVIPDDGKMMHLFVVSDDHSYFGHFHPQEFDSLKFRSVLPIPTGRYRLFGDIVLANGLSQTVTTTVDWKAPSRSVTPSDPDDSWATSHEVATVAPNAVAAAGSGYSLRWTGDASISTGKPIDLRFDVLDSANHVVSRLAPYMGMAGHAVVLRSDDSVFVHLHPMGTVATSAQVAFAARDRGDTSVTGRLNLAPDDTMTMTMPMDGHLSFPYEFPKPGRYRIWVQFKPASQTRALTGAFDIDAR